jgi:hypothetical protein
MNAPLRTLNLVSTQGSERRRTGRAEHSATATVVMAGKTPCAAWLTDVSLHGCCVETRADWLRPGRFVAVGLGEGEALECIVRWSRGGIAGLELLRPIPQSRSDWFALIA